MKQHVSSTITRAIACLLPAAILTAGIALTFTSCGRRVMSADEAAKWIAAYTPAHIDMDAKIRIEMTEAMRAKIKTTSGLDDYFDFTPSVKGTATLSADSFCIDFTPKESMKQGSKYTCRLKMKEFTGVDTLADFSFSFVVDRREMQLADVVATVDPDDVAMMTVGGRIEYNFSAGDSITADSTILTCDYKGVKIIVDKKAVGKSRRFIIRGIKRQSKAAKLTIRTNPLKGVAEIEESIEIPAIADFKLLRAERIDAAEPYINLEFSAPLSSQQDLDGLVSIDRMDDLRIEREGTNVKVYYQQNGMTDVVLRLSELIMNHEGRRLDEDIVQHFKQEVIAPAVEIPFEGSILPDNNNLKLPFRAVNLAAVDVEVVKIFPANVMTFLQENDLDETRELRRFGRLIYHKTVRLDRDKKVNLHQWQNFSIDLKNLFVRERGAIYSIRLSFCRAYSLYNRSEARKIDEITGVTEEDREIWDKDMSYIYWEAADTDWREYKWEERNDPDKPSYYMVDLRMPELNLVASELGMIVKQGADKRYLVAVTNLMSASPISGVEVTAYNYQLQKLATAKTDGNGFAVLAPQGRPFMIKATDGRSTSYLKVTPGSELSTSNFDVSGKEMAEGIKGFTYGDRGVWRPGDDLHLTLILDDKQGNLPRNYPVVMELYNPKEQLYARQALSDGVDGFYVFNVATDESVPTGQWEARFKVGNQTFIHNVRIETIKPNRLKINMLAPDVIQADRQEPMGMTAKWLSGPEAKDMPATMEMILYPDETPFAGYKNYCFTNPLVTFSNSEKHILAGMLDSLGSIIKPCQIGADINSPGMLRANITAKVTEPGGDASIMSKSVRFSPFGVYVGIDLKDKQFETDKDLKFQVVVLNQKGARMKTRELSYKIYRLDWVWWWEGSDGLSRYVKSTSADLVDSGTVTATNGYASISFRADTEDWGRYLVIVRDAQGGHATGGVISVDSPGWEGRAGRREAAGSTELSFTLDKKTYEVGETANVYMPKSAKGKVLLSIENGSKVIKRLWVNATDDRETCVKLPIETSMAPNFYVTATLLRPHSQTNIGDAIRLYGVAGASVIDKRTILHPEIIMTDELHPQEQFTICVKERDNKPMTYTLAVVDEGLLDISNYKTPQPWAAMNQREALGVKTWDMYDDVIGAFGSKFRTILSIGGDEALRKAAGKEKRFNPVVKFIGPFTLNGRARKHRITMPNYVGSVRVMLVAAHMGCYGNADKTVKVTSPLMVLTTLPRTLACGDAVDVPVNVFATDNGIKSAMVKVEVDGPISISGMKTKTVAFDSAREKLVNFKLNCDKVKEGKSRIIVEATSGNNRMRDTTFIDVRNPMPVLIKSIDRSLKAGESTEFDWGGRTMESVDLQIASMPALNFSSSMNFFANYSHLCTEQLSSKALFMLYGRGFLDKSGKAACEKRLPGLLKTIMSRQMPDGGFAYWPGAAEANSWVTSMAGISLIEADRQGFTINRESFDRWIGYQEKMARDYRYSTSTDLDQAYRLYSLALAGKPMKPAMNRLRESKALSQTAAYCLASAYAIDGRTDVAAKLIERAERTQYTKSGDMFHSNKRDEAIRMSAYALTRNTAEALVIARKIATMSTNDGYVTQDLAFATVAFMELSQLVGTGEKSVRVAEHGVKPVVIQNIGSVKNVALLRESGKVVVANTGKGNVEVSLVTSLRPSVAEKIKAEGKGVNIAVEYTDMKGLPLSITKLKQGAEFYARITVKNMGGDIDAAATTFFVPSGWELWNARLFGREENDADYCDIRDDRISFYTPLGAGKSVTYKVRLRAAYVGEYLMPSAVSEDMYNPACRSITANTWVSVVK